MTPEIKQASRRLNWSAQAPANADGCSALGVAPALLLPVLGQHTESVLRELGYVAREIDALVAGGVVRRATDPG